ncbi:MAG: hypothetical protein K2H47_05295 [Muribaculaceae bacterium]|nr:hypothetical protein [Muribaculaceae bacterium]
MTEDQGSEYKPHKVKVNIGTSVSQIALYRFDEKEKGDFMPFFNSSHHEPKRSDDAPKSLRAFCDYIVLAEKNSIVYIILIEMKRGTTAGAEQQLAAGYEFMNYIINSAFRIRQVNNMSDFSRENVIFRRVLLRLPVSPKLKTRPGDIRIEDRHGIIEYRTYNSFNLNRIL